MKVRNWILAAAALLSAAFGAHAQTLTVTPECHIVAPATTCPITVTWNSGITGFLRYGIYAIIADQCTGVLTTNSEPGDQLMCGSAMMGMGSGTFTVNFRTSNVGCSRFLHFSLVGTNRSCANATVGNSVLVTGIPGSSIVWNP